jgi:hypothetical protein
LSVCGAALLVLFVIAAGWEGVDGPTIPSGDVALVENPQGGVAEVSEAELEHAFVLAAAQARERLPKPDEPRYEELRAVATESLLESIWLEGWASERGIHVSDAEVADKLKFVREMSFSSEADFRAFRAELHLSLADVRDELRQEILREKVQRRLGSEAPNPSKGEVESATPESERGLKSVEAQIRSKLARQIDQEAVDDFTTTLAREWTPRTFCADGYRASGCSSFVESAPGSSAAEACYEADPIGGLPEACPASVVQSIPALPGSVTPLEPKGEPLAQRPRPAE